jgi:hypothetical protein
MSLPPDINNYAVLFEPSGAWVAKNQSYMAVVLVEYGGLTLSLLSHSLSLSPLSLTLSSLSHSLTLSSPLSLSLSTPLVVIVVAHLFLSPMRNKLLHVLMCDA